MAGTMIKTFFFTLLCLQGVLSTFEFPSFVCPESTGRFPNPYDCGSFYECTEGIAILTLCPFGKLYNQVLRECDLVQNVDCSNISPLPTQDSSSTTFLGTTSDSLVTRSSVSVWTTVYPSQSTESTSSSSTNLRSLQAETQVVISFCLILANYAVNVLYTLSIFL